MTASGIRIRPGSLSVPGKTDGEVVVRTRDRILEAGLRLFNQDGLAKVSTNRIAAELEMSPGNLYYHFKSKEQLVEWLFRRLEQDIAPFTESCASLDAIDDVWLALHLGFETVERYRFLFADVEYLLREYPRTGERMKKLTSSAIDAISAMCHSLARAGVIVAEAEQIDSLAFHIVFTATCWETFVKLMPVKDVETARTGIAAYHVLTLLNPYLTAEARQYMHYLRKKYLA